MFVSVTQKVGRLTWSVEVDFPGYMRDFWFSFMQVFEEKLLPET